MGTRAKSNGNGETRPSDQLGSPRTVKEWQWVGTGASDLFPATTLSFQWIRDNNISEELIANSGLYNPVYEEDITDGTRSQAATENTDGVGTN